MFANMKKTSELKTKIEELEQERDKLKECLSDLRLEKKTTEEDIKHMVRITDERREIQMERERVAMQKELQEGIAEVKDKYRDKMEDNLKEQLDQMGVMYKDILARLPNVNVRLKGDA